MVTVHTGRHREAEAGRQLCRDALQDNLPPLMGLSTFLSSGSSGPPSGKAARPVRVGVTVACDSLPLVGGRAPDAYVKLR